MTSRKPLVAGNWKMNGDTAANEQLLAGLRKASAKGLSGQVETIVCPPYPYLGQVRAGLAGSGIAWGAQNVAAATNGALTGEVSASMLVDLGCSWAIVGHSERRTLLGETDETIATKASLCLAEGLGVVACVGETLAERERDETEAVLTRQVAALVPALGGADASRVVLAYEPVWAIGTGRTASPEIAQQAHAFIRAQLAAAGHPQADAVRIVYGGSVKAANARSLFAMPDVDGGLIGGASLVAEEFLGICTAAAV
jgi:triosephosphate isomerase